MSEQGLFFEDLYVGQAFRAGPLTLSAEDMKRFARENDPQYFHVDEEAAKSGMFGGLIGSGWQTAALSMRLLICDSKIFATGVVGAGGELEWRRPTLPGDSLNVTCEIIETTPLLSRSDIGMTRIKVTTRNQNADTLMTLVAKLLVRRRSAGLDEGAHKAL